MELPTEIAELRRIRLEEDLTYLELGKQIGISERTLYRLLNFPDVGAFERTMFKIRRFLEQRQSTSTNSRRQKAAASR